VKTRIIIRTDVDRCLYIGLRNKMDEDDFPSLYCIICGACGEEGCCQPVKCRQHPDGLYCEMYAKLLEEKKR
jgi:hypothetical protein